MSYHKIPLVALGSYNSLILLFSFSFEVSIILVQKTQPKKLEWFIPIPSTQPSFFYIVLYNCFVFVFV